eukprot:5109801-Amphidinium_carterae.1
MSERLQGGCTRTSDVPDLHIKKRKGFQMSSFATDLIKLDAATKLRLDWDWARVCELHLLPCNTSGNLQNLIHHMYLSVLLTWPKHSARQASWEA